MQILCLYRILLLNIYSSKTNLLGEKAFIGYIKIFFTLKYISVCTVFICKVTCLKLWNDNFSVQPRDEQIGKPSILYAGSGKSKHSDLPLSRPLSQNIIPFYLSQMCSQERVSFLIRVPEWDSTMVKGDMVAGSWRRKLAGTFSSTHRKQHKNW